MENSALPRPTDMLEWPYSLDHQSVVAKAIIPGEPVSKSRPRFAHADRVVAYTPDAVRRAETNVALMVRCSLATAWHRNKNTVAYPDPAHAYGVRMCFCNSTRRGKDADNMAKLVMDALNGIIWVDDRQVEEMHVRVIRSASVSATHLVVYRVPRWSV